MPPEPRRDPPRGHAERDVELSAERFPQRDAGVSARRLDGLRSGVLDAGTGQRQDSDGSGNRCIQLRPRKLFYSVATPSRNSPWTGDEVAPCASLLRYPLAHAKRIHPSRLPVLRLHVVGERLGLLVSVVVVVVTVAIVLGSDVLHLIDATTLRAPLDGALA